MQIVVKEYGKMIVVILMVGIMLTILSTRLLYGWKTTMTSLNTTDTISFEEKFKFPLPQMSVHDVRIEPGMNYHILDDVKATEWDGSDALEKVEWNCANLLVDSTGRIDPSKPGKYKVHYQLQGLNGTVERERYILIDSGVMNQ